MFLISQYSFLLFISTTISYPSKITPNLYSVLQSKGSANLKVSFLATNVHLVQDIRIRNFPTREARLNTLASTLKDHALKTQSRVIQVITEFDPTQNYLPLWVSNHIFLPNASASLAVRIAAMPEVSEVNEEYLIVIEPDPPATPAPDEHIRRSRASLNRGWSIEWIHAPDSWKRYGSRGRGVTVASIDTGVLHTHEALSSNFRSSYGWFDPYGLTLEPTDPDGHGTHVIGTICGSHGIGVAPEANWISCRGCADYGCSESALLSCGQWLTCPTDISGKNPDCTQAPHIINNSWDVPPGTTWFDPIILAWRAAGIIPVFAAGNNGTRCGSISYPGEHPDVITVGATDETNMLANYSSKGPGIGGSKKPDVCAPGESIMSASNKGPTRYKMNYGTSMAVPHVVGAIALLLSVNQSLTYDEVKEALIRSAMKVTHVPATGFSCGGIQETMFPNNEYGAGVIDTVEAIQYTMKSPDSNTGATL